MTLNRSLLTIAFLLLLLPSFEVIAQVVWKNCGNKANIIKLRELTSKPYPIEAPGSATIAITFYTSQNLTDSGKAILSLKRTVLFGMGFPIPCVNGVGSCTYDNLCGMCSLCSCPFIEGEYSLNLPITIDSKSIAGTYHGKIDLETNTGQRGCVELSNVKIVKS